MFRNVIDCIVWIAVAYKIKLHCSYIMKHLMLHVKYRNVRPSNSSICGLTSYHHIGSVSKMDWVPLLKLFWMVAGCVQTVLCLTQCICWCNKHEVKYMYFSRFRYRPSNITWSVLSLINRINLPVPVAERSKARVCGRSLAGSAGSNPAGGKDVCVVICK